jgi:uncharacterized protein DUF3300
MVAIGRDMKTFLRLLFCAALGFVQIPAHAQSYSQPELDAMLAPIALYPDPLLSQVLMAATFPDQVREAADWSRANPQFQGDVAVRAVQTYPWDPSVKALVAVPELLARMAESPQWTVDLGNAFLAQQAQVMDTVQMLRQRAYAQGYLRSDSQQYVEQQGSAIAVQPVSPQVVYVPYYDPYIVYGAWWWPAFRPVYWRPWYARPVFVSAGFFPRRFDWRHRAVNVVQVHNVFVRNGPPSPAAQAQAAHTAAFAARARAANAPSPARQFQRIPESQRQPIVRSAAPVVNTAPAVFHNAPAAVHTAPHGQWRSEVRQGGQRSHGGRRG